MKRGRRRDDATLQPAEIDLTPSSRPSSTSPTPPPRSSSPPRPAERLTCTGKPARPPDDHGSAWYVRRAFRGCSSAW